ncbi:MAG: PadR family transcriptional regulator [Gemmatimonadales bacterium]
MTDQGPAREAASRQGTIDMLILQTLTVGSAHGYAIAQHISLLSDDVLRLDQGSLYPALERLQRNGWVTSAWRKTPTGRRARYYTITNSGCEQLGARVSDYRRVAAAIEKILRRA